MRVAKEDIEKTTMKTRYGSYKFVVMPFSLCNVLLNFMTFMNLVLYAQLNDFIILYLDDILIFSKDKAKHVEQILIVLKN